MRPRHPRAAELYDSDPVLADRWDRITHLASADHWSPEDRIDFVRAEMPSLLTESAKTIKSLKVRALTGIMYLSPSDEAGVDVCPFASAGCRAACLGHSSGRMGMTVNGGLGDHKRARILRTWLFTYHRALFLALVRREIEALVRRARAKRMRPFVRLNGTSDLPVESWGFCEEFPSVQFYDYTKNVSRALAWACGELPRNYHLTFSRSETNDAACRKVLAASGNVAMVFAEQPDRVWYWYGRFDMPMAGPLPGEAEEFFVINGDETDARPDDRRGVVVGLSAKGPLAKRDRSGFVIR